ncbi:C-type lectin domain family 4 member C-like [Tenrec ecaudatus]|uniref:C-type lectin domain family 4 member C-like n=1 Tax=Tenrec ecaudatus TaxID=94439 RepID=UPI003F5A766B
MTKSGKGWVCCPENWFASNTSCYWVSSGSNTWTKSQKTCSEMGAHLLVVNTKEEQNFIIPNLQRSSAYYVGLSDPEGKQQWQWVDGSPYNKSATFWHPGEPSNQDEQCVMINSRGGSWGWNDARCDSPQRSICEMKKISF